jgi:hypothetical protein
MDLHTASNFRRQILRAVLLLAMDASDHSMDDSRALRVLRQEPCIEGGVEVIAA